MFVPRGLMIVNPMERGLRVVSFHEFYSVSTACITIEFLLSDHPQGVVLIRYTAISRKVVRKNVHATIPNSNMIYDQYIVSDTVAVEPTFVAFL